MRFNHVYDMDPIKIVITDHRWTHLLNDLDFQKVGGPYLDLIDLYLTRL